MPFPSHPLARIAMSLSGGGYRAASFHLGSMSYLHTLRYEGKPLLENIKMISTVSGGTITGVVYAMMKQQGKTFEEIYHFLLNKLETTDLLKEGITKLSPSGEWNNAHKTKNLINAFAELYDHHLTSGETFALFDTMRSHLEAVVFNSTEFRYAIDFRFRDVHSGLFGNQKVPLPHDVARQIKLSDAIACSSCFTGGFEPMLFPRDFVYDGADKIIAQQNKKLPQLGLMDGGIYDNQGIEAILLYDKLETKEDFDLVIISDVASPHMEEYEPMAPKKQSGFRNMTISGIAATGKRVNLISTLILVAAAVLCFLLPLRDDYAINFRTGLCVGLGVACLLLLGVTSVIGWGMRSMVKYVAGMIRQVIPDFHREKLANLQIEKIKFGRMEPLIIDRINSLVTLMMEVFLKVIRRLNYDKLYDDRAYQFRRISNLIQELTKKDYEEKRERNRKSPPEKKRVLPDFLEQDYNLAVGDSISGIVEKSSKFGTTLWFTDKPGELHSMLDMLVATGQFTMCYNLVVYLYELMYAADSGFNKLPAEARNEIQKIYGTVVQDWRKFQGDAMYMVQQMKTGSSILN